MKRIGAFAHARKQGMSADAARAYSEKLYPSSSDDFIFEANARNADASSREFPWPSAGLLLYPIGASITIAKTTPANFSTIVGYGFAQLGYLLLGASIFSRTFGVFRLGKRWQIVVVGIACLGIGTALCALSI